MNRVQKLVNEYKIKDELDLRIRLIVMNHLYAWDIPNKVKYAITDEISYEINKRIFEKKI